MDQVERPLPFLEKNAEEQKAWMMSEYGDLAQVKEDGLTFANKTAQWIAYDRMLETDRADGLFKDPLAKHFVGEYGKRCSDCFALGGKGSFFTEALGLNGFVNYHAARTKLISDRITAWVAATEGKKQVLNLGAGMDTRAFWDESLKGIDAYVEVDAKPVNDHKETAFNKIKEAGKLPEPHAKRQVISLDFDQESTADIPKHGVDFSAPTLWLLEGLVMYLTAEANEKMYNELSDLSAPGSHVILNFLNDGQAHHGALFARKLLEEKSWTVVDELMFGDAKFNYGKYPQGAEPSKMAGFVFLKK